MAIRVARPTVTLASFLFFCLGQFALAQNTGNAPGAGPGSTSRPAVGTDVQPSTAIQKDQTGRSSASGGDTSNAAGAPKVSPTQKAARCLKNGLPTLRSKHFVTSGSQSRAAASRDRPNDARMLGGLH
jgi:hypothetical protein